MESMVNKTYAVDRIEGDVAVCECLETGVLLSVEVSELPQGVKEGDVVVKGVDGFAFDEEQTEDRRSRLSSRLDRLFRKN